MPELDAPFDYMLFTIPNQEKSSDQIFMKETGDDEIWWSKEDIPSQTKAWKEIAGNRIPCTFYTGFGFMTEQEVWDHKQKYPRDSL